ncbi:transketolase [soil metagenome]
MTLTTTPGHQLADDARIDQLAIDTVRFLAVDMVEAAGSGHPGLPLGAAPMAWTLFSRHLRHDPRDPRWADRDRFVLSAGHGSALHYALLHVLGYDLPVTELQRFRQLGSTTPGHPEVGHTVGVETTTGPLGQGLATAVGLALGERMLAAHYPTITHHRTWVLAGDGCLMEGISHEAASLAGHLGLGRLIVLWDDNRITIDGAVDSASTDDQGARFTAYGWHVVRDVDGSDVEAVDAALSEAKADPRPSLVAVRTVIGAGATGVAGTPKAHGTPLGVAATAQLKQGAGWSHPAFTVPEEVREATSRLADDGAEAHERWRQAYDELAARSPASVAEWERRRRGDLPDDWEETLAGIAEALRPDGAPGSRATRQSSHEVLTALAAALPELVGGSADLAGSTGVDTGQPLVTSDDASGARVGFGVREHAMAAVLNGLSLHGGFRSYGSTFLVFSDYLRPALRLSALMCQPVVYVLTHDSVAVGEDGPTHQPIEHVESLRLIPGVRVLRPADDLETLAAWRSALERTDGPTVLVLSRQALPGQESSWPPPRMRVLRDHPAASVELVATGSEVSTALEVADLLSANGAAVRVVSCSDRSDYEPSPDALTVSLEAGVTAGWRGLVDLAIGIDEFGRSGPGEEVLSALGLDPDTVAARVRDALAARQTETKIPTATTGTTTKPTCEEQPPCPRS